MRNSPGPVSWRALASVLLAMLLCLIVVSLVVALPPHSWWAPRMPPRVYDRAPLVLVLADMERHGVLPAGTEWGDVALKSRPVTERFYFLPEGLDALDRIAVSAGVVIEFPRGYHGEITGPARVTAAGGREPGLAPYRAETPRP